MYPYVSVYIECGDCPKNFYEVPTIRQALFSTSGNNCGYYLSVSIISCLKISAIVDI